MSGRLADKVTIVTGAAAQGDGIGNGNACALLFAREGAKVLLVNRSAERAGKLRQQIADEGGTAEVFAGDITRQDTAEEMAEAAKDYWGRVDVLVNNVGIGGGGNVITTEEETWNSVIDTNLKSALFCTKACIPFMSKSGGGSIINMSSVAGATGLQSDAGAVAYTTSKAGLHGFTISVAADFAKDNIRCNCIIIGTVNTPLVAKLGEAARKRRADMVPLQKEGTGWDVGWGAVYLASDESRWVTGAFLPIDGGLLAIRPWPR